MAGIHSVMEIFEIWLHGKDTFFNGNNRDWDTYESIIDWVTD